MKQLCLTIVLVLFLPNAYGAPLKKTTPSKTIQKKKINIKTIRTVKTVEKQINQIQKGIDTKLSNVQKSVDNQLRNIQNIRVPKVKSNIPNKVPTITKGFQKGTTLLTKELAKVDRSKLLSAPIILKSPVKQNLKPTKTTVTNKGLSVAKKNTPNLNKRVTNTPKVPKVVFVLPVPPVAKKITLPASLVRR